MTFSVFDHEMMARAIQLAKQGVYTTTPNPRVGCVIVKNDKIIGEGFHQYAGGPHAEVNAIANVINNGETTDGATCYVTLEPCSHYGRTPPCAEGLVKANVAKVIVGMVDPNPQVSGRGIEILKAAGIQVESGLLEAESEKLNPGFNKKMRTNMPFVTAKLAASLDGKTALKNGKSKWITGPSARQDVQLQRAQFSALLSGADTVLIDNAKLNVRWQSHPVLNEIEEKLHHQPVRIIIDTQYRLTPDLALFSQSGKVVIVRSKEKAQASNSAWPANVEEWFIEETSAGYVNLKALMEKCAKSDLHSIWLEAGATLCGAMLNERLVDQLILYQAPKIMGNHAASLLNLPECTEMKQVPTFSINVVTQVADDIKIDLTPIYSAEV